MKKIYNEYPTLTGNQYIPLDHCVSCYRPDDECECEDIDVMEKLEELDAELTRKLKIQKRLK